MRFPPDEPGAYACGGRCLGFGDDDSRPRPVVDCGYETRCGVSSEDASESSLRKLFESVLIPNGGSDGVVCGGKVGFVRERTDIDGESEIGTWGGNR